MKITLINHYNLNNGDRAVLAGTLYALANNGVNKVTISCFKPELFSVPIELNNLNYSIVPWGVKANNLLQRALFKIFFKNLNFKVIKIFESIIFDKKFRNSINDSDLVLVSGGHHLTDIVGDNIFYRLAFDMIYSIMKGKKVILLPQTIGPFKNSNKLKSKIIKFIIEKAHCVALRDKNSLEFIKMTRIKDKNLKLLPDIVYELYQYLKSNSERKSFNKNIGIAIYGNYTGPAAAVRIERYINELINAIDELVNKGWNINFIPMEDKASQGDDRKLIDKIMQKVNNKKNIRLVEESKGYVTETIKNFSKNDIIIAYKTHSVIFSLIQAIPVLGVAYHRKSVDFMEAYGLRDYVIWDEEASSKMILKKIEMIGQNYDYIVELEKNRALEYYSQIDSFMKNILA